MPTQPTGARRWTIMCTALLGAFTFSLNARGTVLESELIVQNFALDHYKVQWITGPEGVAGLTAFFSSIYLIKLFGARRAFIIGAFLLTGGCLIVSLAQTALQVGIGGVVRNCAGLYMIPNLTIFQRLTPGRQRIAYCIYLTLVYAGQVVVEPLGALIAFHPSWRALYVILAICGLWLILAGFFLYPDDRPDSSPEHPFDFAGTGLFMVGLALVFFLLYRGNYLGWQVSTPIWAAAAALIVVFVLFVWREVCAPEPFIPMGAFAYRTIALTMLVSAFWCASLYGVALQLPNFLLTLGYERWKTGWVMLPMGLLLVAIMLLGASIWRRNQYVWLLRVGLAGMTVVGLELARLDLFATWQWLMGMSCLWAVFAGICLAPIAQLTYQGQLPAAAATTGAMKFLVRSFSGTVAILAAAVVLDRSTAGGLEYVRASVVQGQGTLQVVEPALRTHMEHLGSAPAAAADEAQSLLGSWVDLHAQVIGFRSTLRFCAYLSGVGAILSCFISRRKEFSVFDADSW
jgi:MFS family permease